MKRDFLIIGQGLAGTLVGHALEKLNASFMVLDQVKPYAASPIAAGIIHPVSGRRFTKAWGYDTFLPVFKNTYDEIAYKLNFEVLKSQEMHMYLSSAKEDNDLLSQSERYGYAEQLRPLWEDHPGFKTTHCKYSLPSYKLDITKMIELFRRRWISRQILFADILDYNQLHRVGNAWQYRDVRADQVIFCEGVFIKDNPWFAHLPIVANKGQAFLIKMDNKPPMDYTVKHGLLFTEFNQKIWAGASYEWEFDTPSPDSQGWKFLSQKILTVLNNGFSIENHVAGLRPTVADRKPIVASHPVYPNLWAVNGFGTKGASTGPLVVRHLIDLITGKEKMNAFAPDRLKESLP